jgi:triosephosphate isomerase
VAKHLISVKVIVIFEVVGNQVKEALSHLSDDQMREVVVAYEPVWAIGTGETASPDQAQEMHAHIRSVITEMFTRETAEEVSILYGGSCKPSNAKELFANPDVDGGLIGGASLKAEDFVAIVEAMKVKE